LAVWCSAEASWRAFRQLDILPETLVYFGHTASKIDFGVEFSAIKPTPALFAAPLATARFGPA
jgi:hypothetical protein